MRNQPRINKTVGVLIFYQVSLGKKIPHVILYSNIIKNDDRIKQHCKFKDFNNIYVIKDTKIIDYI